MATLTDERWARIEAAVQAHQHPDAGTSPDMVAYALADAVPDLLAEIERLRAALDKAAGQLGYLSTVLSHSNKPSNAKGALEWSEAARAVLEESQK